VCHIAARRIARRCVDNGDPRRSPASACKGSGATVRDSRVAMRSRRARRAPSLSHSEAPTLYVRRASTIRE
jgi:hypothetical protein